MGASGCDQSLRRFVKRFKTEAKRAVMHRNQSLRMQLKKCFHRLLWIHVNFAASHCVVSANGKQCDFDIKAVADFLEPGEISGVATEKNGSSIRRDNDANNDADQFREKSGSQ